MTLDYKTETAMATEPIDSNNESYVLIDGESYWKISDFNKMRPFLMTVVSATDHWMFISSNGGISAGRKNPDSALFPYYTDDMIMDMAEITGSKTILKVERNGEKYLWEPFSERYGSKYQYTRNLYKNRTGNKVLFEEINDDLKLVFRYAWTFSDKYGFVREATAINIDKSEVRIEMLDGIQNILPYGLNSDLQSQRSTLVDAYKKNELDRKSGIGIFSLSSMIVDKAEPSETLSATTVWSTGIEVQQILLSALQLMDFRFGRIVNPEFDVRAEKGAYFINSSIVLGAGQEKTWYIIAELNQAHKDIVNLRNERSNTPDIKEHLRLDIQSSTKALSKLVGMADGFQKTNDVLSSGRHYSNVLFNIMRGGIFDEQYEVEKVDFMEYSSSVNSKIYEKHQSFFSKLPHRIDHPILVEMAKEYGDDDIFRICLEYLPIFFSRRHGDPSRPWNYFSIETKNKRGDKVRNYEGNWRDIFQNWEALAYSFPEYVECFITKFVNASTIDGYNPYRISREGIDWEVADEDDPWSYIGYWGDHQIIYLLKLLEISKNHHPDILNELLNKEVFVFADVPYRIKSFLDIVKDPQDTIEYDYARAKQSNNRYEAFGADGKLLHKADDEILKVNLAEKIVLPIASKLTNFIPDAGIWLNTQRPEWNDANNALVGNGVSMVTLYYLRRHLDFCIDFFTSSGHDHFNFGIESVEMIDGLIKVFNQHHGSLEEGIDSSERRAIIYSLGEIGETYRAKVYDGVSGQKTPYETSKLVELFTISLRYIDEAISTNKRKDGLYHAYNLISIDENGAYIDRLYEMLEGQVAVLSSGRLTPKESLDVLNALKSSNMFRSDQYSYMLYPDRKLPRFLEKNTIDKDLISGSALLSKLMEDGNSEIFDVDINGDHHFNGEFHNADDINRALEKLSKNGYPDLVEKDHELVLEAFEQVFDHSAFTGRSGTFYGYEGLGSIYWHMVSKLLLACQEVLVNAHDEKEEEWVIGSLIEHYYEIRAGIGVNKPAELYGAFPTDAYSHTPGNAGAQQPGMTGQVKEDVINRWAELGIEVKGGQLSFNPKFLRDSEFLEEAMEFDYFDLEGVIQSIHLPEGSLGFTYCQVPVIYRKSNSSRIHLVRSNGKVEEIEGSKMSEEQSNSIFRRDDTIASIEVYCTSWI